MKKIFCIGAVLSFCFLLFSGCQMQNNRKQIAEELLTAVLTVPNEKLMAALASDADASEAPTAFAAEAQNIYGGFVPEDTLLDSKLFDIVLTIHLTAFNKGFSIQVEQLEVTENPSNASQYNYTASTIFTLADGEQENLEFQGTIQFDEHDKVDYLSAAGSGMKKLGNL